MVWIIVIVSMLVVPLVRTEDTTVTTEVCHGDTRPIGCSNDSVIVIDFARFGRMEGSCFTNSAFGYLNCSEDVKLYLERMCAGRRSCPLRHDGVLERSNHGCPKDLKTNLRVGHHCLRVETPRTSKCDGSSYPVVTTTTPSGYLARVVTMETRIGSVTCPWSIEVRSGQIIRLTLYDFGLWEDQGTTAPGPGYDYGSRPVCLIYATIGERAGTATPRTVCGAARGISRGVDGGRVVYVSNSNSVQVVAMTTNSPTQEQFLLKYEVVGCADPVPPPPHTEIQRISDRLIIKCNRDDGLDPEPKAWTIQCLDAGNWSTPLSEINCSALVGNKYKASSEFAGSGLLLVVAISAAVIVALLVITCGLFILYRRRQTREEEESQMPLPASEYRFPPSMGPTPGYNHWAPTEGAPYTPGAPVGPGTLMIPWPPGLERRPSADCLERDYATTLQMRLNAMPCSASNPSISSTHQLPPSAGLGPYGILPYDPRTMMVYCPFHGTLTRVNGAGHSRERLGSEHRYEEVPLEPAACPTGVGTDGNTGEQQVQQQERQPLQRQPSGLYHELNY